MEQASAELMVWAFFLVVEERCGGVIFLLHLNVELAVSKTLLLYSTIE